MSAPDTNPTRLVAAAGGPPSSLKVRSFKLRVVEGPDTGRSCRSLGDRATVGTAHGTDLELSDRTVSRVHLEIAATGDGFLLRDLDSTNGCYLSGYRVREVYLRHGARVGIGHTLIEFTLGEEENDVALSPQAGFGPLVGASPSMRRVFALLERIAPTDATVLVEGETGTGKELVARAIHEHSSRREGPFVVVDAGSLPSTLVESELFGHERGAFTGATASRAGAFEEANNGTVFLDELGELPLDLQPKLLRVLEQREIRRLGGNRTAKVDVRVVAATNRDLRTAINKGNFRADLYYRLAVVTLSLPPLRERRSDISLLARTFLDDLGARAGRALELSDLTLDKLQRLPWNGNVRELRNFIERSLWLSEGRELQVTGMLEEHSPVAPSPDMPVHNPQESPLSSGPQVELLLPYKVAKKHWTEYFDRVYLPEILERCKGNVSKAAREAQLDRAYLFRMLQRYGMKG